MTLAKTFHPLAARGLERSSRIGAACLALGRGLLRVLVTLGALLLLWWGLTDAFGLVSGMRFPGPAQTLAAGQQILFDGYGNALWHEHALRSVRLVGLGFVVAATPGVLLGLAMGASRTVEALVNPVFLLLRPIPPLAWIPLAIVWLGLGDAAKVMVIFVAAFVPSVINSFSGVRQIDRPLLEASAMLRITGWRYWREVLIPGALPSIFTGLRLSLQASWTTLVAAELVGAVAGLGQILNQGAQDIHPPMILVGMISVALCGWLMTRALAWFETRAMPWRQP
ncbi:binding-protein-dependent transport systems inner membrane component [Verminephrobacter eiseniae EF01-2]|uniref:Binding-protein-dependent transport systems inner membrane component n=1 Tax=Verminephrobacter eiseniae (strain EF01-2) TaxID=391735 RepID=A1WFY8_VEREI|nr:ABC transporter permease [Verminephrobacter eiseniae]ABM56545.1 binding-protein-dependent transport systems inner membrane component [Verminephrobacter eiseniae EF01-2]